MRGGHGNMQYVNHKSAVGALATHAVHVAL